MDDVKQALIAYGLDRLAEATGNDALGLTAALGQIPNVNWAAYEDLLGEKAEPEAALSSIFSRVVLSDQGQEQTPLPTTMYHPALALDIREETLFSTSLEKAQAKSDRDALWRGFAREYGQLRRDGDALFVGFYHLYLKWAWALPCLYGEPGVSLFEQWKAVAALALASGTAWAAGPASEFTLVGGDIPGIQSFVYTITSKGAAKALRGRSLFIQFLGDAVVRRLVHDLDLSPANVIYAAGGNFMLLAPAGQRTQDVVSQVEGDVNRLLLDTYDGDIALCLASVPLPAQAVGTQEFGARYSIALKQAIAQQKARRFAAIANAPDGWQRVFGPEGGGGEQAHFCVVCQAELSAGELKDDGLLLTDVGELEPGETAPRACADCATFRELAEAVGHPHLALYLRRGRGPGQDRWQELLFELSGWWYRFGDWAKGAPPNACDLAGGETKYVLNHVDFVNLAAHGFLFFANTTPRATPQDAAWWDETYPAQRDQVRPGSIRSFELLAHAAGRDGALERVGVLRMDVDDLGRVMTRGLVRDGQPHRSMAATSALSAAMDRFFGGYLDVLCREVTARPGMAGLTGHADEDLFYVIYAGGDDLFVVGPWHILVLLAQQVHDAFARYVGGNPFLHISAGLTLEERKFPLYQAATRAGQALDGGAKEHEHTDERGRPCKKNAIQFLGQTLGWRDLAEVRERTDALVRLVQQEGVPRGLLQTLQMIYSRFVEDQRAARRRGLRNEQVYYGPWMWRQAYHLKRFGSDKPEKVQQEIDILEKWTLKSHRIQHLGLVARWAEYLTRSKEE